MGVSFDPLDRVVTLLDDAFREGGWHQPHFLVMVEDADGESFSLGTRPLPPNSHPLEHLLGFVAPASWSAFGAVCFGRVVPGDRRARVVTLVARTGEQHAVASFDDGTVIDEPAAGSVTDALRRCLGLPTPPPPCSTADVFASHWLASVLAAGGGTRRMTWAEVSSLRAHPSFGVVDWADLRRTVAAGSPAPAGVSADVAAWMDDGMFARWVMGGHPPVDRLVDQLSAVQLPNVMRRIRKALASNRF